MEPSGDTGSIHWKLSCLSSKHELLLDLPLPKSSPVSSRFAVPGDCEAQQLVLAGFSQVYPAEVGLSIAALQIRKAQ
jgi:hypothetical protein